MASLFVSHSSQDAAKTAELVGRLRAEGFEALFVDFDPDVGVPAGRNWERELYAQLRKADAVVFLASPAALASQWCTLEVGIARAIGKPIFPVLLAGGWRHPLLEDLQWVDLASDGAGAFRRLLVGLYRAGLDPADAFDWDPKRSPYPGLEPFCSDDAAVFFGRDAEIDRLLELLQPTLQHAAGRFVGIMGPSGSGKSSLLRAGLLPRLQRLPERWVVLPALRPGQHPLKGLARSLAEAFAVRGQPFSSGDLAARLERAPGELVELAGKLAETGSGEPKVLVVIDQAEELVTRTGPRDQQRFLGLLRSALSETSPLWVVATLRSEFLSIAPERAGLAEAIDDVVVVEPLSRGRLAEVIERPAHRAGLEFAPGLVERMIEETTGGDALPLLAYTLRELYQRAGVEGAVSIADYEALGGVVGALQRRADQVLDELRRRGQGGYVLPTLLRLATVEGEAEPTRRRLRRDVLSSDEQAVARAFVDARLLTTDREDDAATVEVAHEALLRQWSPLRQAIEDSRASLRLRSELERAAADWDQGRRDESYLLRGGRLASFEDWAGSHDDELTDLERQFLQASRAVANRELEAARRSNRRLRHLASGLAAILVIAISAALLAANQTRVARRQARVALSRQLAAQALALLDTRPETAVLLALEGVRAADTEESTAALQEAVGREHHVSSQLIGHQEAVEGVAMSPDGRTVASASQDGSVRLWNVQTRGELGQPLRGHEGWVHAVAFTPDGRTLASASEDETIRLWDVGTRRPLGQPLRGHLGGILDVAFSPDGKTLASASADRTVRLWGVGTPRPLGQPLRGHQDLVRSVAFSPDGKTLASASEDETIRLWDVGTRRPLGQPLRGHQDAVWDVAFSRDGTMLASASADKTVRVWDARTRRALGEPLRGHADSVWGVAFSPDGRTVASGSRDETVRLWNVHSRRALGPPLRGHEGWVWDVAFSPDGKHVASASGDSLVRWWEVSARQALGEQLSGHEDSVWGVAFSPDGRTLASAGRDRTVRLWDVGARRALGEPVRGHEDWVNDVAFSPDGRIVASASSDHTVRLWDVRTRRALGEPLRGHENAVLGVAFSPDGTMLASSGADATVRLWDVRTRRAMGQPLRGQTGDTSVNDVAFSPDGTILASAGGDRTVRLWDVRSRRGLGEPLRGHEKWVTGVSFSADGTVLASAGSDGTVRLWGVRTHRALGEPLRGHRDDVYRVAFSPDGKILASTSEDETIRLWDVGARRALGTPLRGHEDGVFGVAFSPDGDTLASASDDNTIRLWKLRLLASGSWVREACRLANRNLSRSEWDEFVGLDNHYVRTCPDFPAPG